MSVQNKLSAARKLAAALKKWPDDSHKVYNSFRNAQLRLYDSDTPSKLPSAETLELRIIAANNIFQDTNAKRFSPNTRIFKPDGNPHYYDLIRREANREQANLGLVTALKNTLFGWWKK